MHRAFPGWHLVGDVSLESGDLAGELAELRQKALLLDASGLRTKLVLPDDQIKYLEINRVAGEDLPEAVRNALEGATPYAVSDLAYDYAESGDSVTIAAVARETLAEAEAFAVDHKFNPVSFVAQCATSEFHGEPFFGLTVAAADQDVERDTAPVRVIGASKLPDTADAPEGAAEASPVPDVEPGKVVEPDAVDEPEPEVEAVEAEEPASLAEPEPATATEPDTAPEPEPVAEPESEMVSDPEPNEADAEPELEVAPELEPEEPVTEPEPVAGPEPAEDTASQDVDDAAEGALEDDPAAAEDNSTLVAENALPDVDEAPDDEAPDIEPEGIEPEPQVEELPAAESATAFASIRARRDDAGAASPRLDGVQRDALPPRITLGAASDPEPAAAPPDVTGISEAELPADTPAPMLLRTDAPDPAPEDSAPPPPAEAKPAFFTRRVRSKKRKADPHGSDIAAPQDEKQRMTIFGAREQSVVGGKPRFLGLILTAVLLLFLIGVAAWASIFMEDGLARFFRAEPAPMVADLPETDPAEEVQDEVELASLQPSENVSVLDDPATEILSRVQPSDLSPDEAKARYAATGIWQLAPEPSLSPEPTELQEFYQTSLDPEPGFQDAVALPETASADTDGMMFSPAAPPAPTTRFVFDARGFVLATPEGALTPDAVMVFAGRPAALPPSQRGTAEPERTESAEEEVTEAQVAAIRPRARPDDMAEQIERNELSGRTRSELAALRPKLRPESAQEAAEAARLKAEAEAAEELAKAEAETAAAASTTDPEALQAALAEAAQTPDPFAGATAQAVRASLKPKTKPRNFDRIVQRTKRDQARQQDEEEVQQTAVAVRASQRVNPKIPTTASVAKRATERNALKFKRVNLIGVYGTPSKRRALVRMSNGRYKKVSVGDRLDGGRVQAIGDSDLRYKKGGRTVVLKMPRG